MALVSRFPAHAAMYRATPIADQHKDLVEQLNKAYDAWWDEVLPCMENEQAYKTAPKENPFKEQYRKQFGETEPGKKKVSNRSSMEVNATCKVFSLCCFNP